MELERWVQILPEAVCIQFALTGLGKGMNLSFPLLVIGKIVRQTGLSSFGE